MSSTFTLHLGVPPLQVRDEELFPADLMCLYSELPENVCYIKTTNLDGETNLKIKKPLDLKGLPVCSKLMRGRGHRWHLGWKICISVEVRQLLAKLDAHCTHQKLLQPQEPHRAIVLLPGGPFVFGSLAPAQLYLPLCAG